MKLYFSGFSLLNEKELFPDYLVESDFTVSGFSYGCIKALNYVNETENRVNKIQLFSPAYFNDKDTKYKRMQLIFFKKDSLLYCDNFLKNSGLKEGINSKYFSLGKYEDLDTLLFYNWSEDVLQKVLEKNIKIEVYLGSEDKIINSEKALEFFKKYAEVYYIKNKGHIL